MNKITNKKNFIGIILALVCFTAFFVSISTPFSDRYVYAEDEGSGNDPANDASAPGGIGATGNCPNAGCGSCSDGNQGNGPDGSISGCTQSCTGGRNDTCSWSCPPPPTSQPTPPSVAGVCSATTYACSVGTANSGAENSAYWTWNCQGTDGGATVSCSNSKPPVVTLNASPSIVNSGSLSNLSWSVTGASSCSAGNAWSSAKNPLSGSESVYPVITSTYILTCSGPGGGPVSSQAIVQVPNGSITAGSCIIGIGQPSCGSAVSWTSSDFMGTPEVLQNNTVFDTRAIGSDNREVTPDNRRFTLRDTVGTFSTYTDASVGCAPGSVWAGLPGLPLTRTCVRLPDIEIESTPEIIRSGNTASLDIRITAEYDMRCTLTGGINQLFDHTGSPSEESYTYETNSLTAGQVVTINCEHSTFGSPVVGSDETRIDVIPTVEEI